MTISFKHTIPLPLQGQNLDNSEIWNKNVNINSGNNYLIKSESGKGKSTLISYCYGLRKDFVGEIFINNNELKKITIDEWSTYRKNKLSIIPQNLLLFSEMSSLENLMIKNNLNDHKSKSEVLEMLEQLNMLKYKDQKASTLSLGQQQRLVIIRALLQPFELLLMDEPFSHIDDYNINKSIQLILKECNANKSGFILTSLGDDYGIKNMEVLEL